MEGEKKIGRNGGKSRICTGRSSGEGEAREVAEVGKHGKRGGTGGE